MKSICCTWKRIRVEAQLIAGLLLVSNCLAVPSINSVSVAPTPLITGQAFTVTVSASSDVAQGVVTVDFRPWATRILRLTLAKQGDIWTGTGIVPADLQPPGGAEATVKVLLFDAARQRVEQTVKVLVSDSANPSAVFDPATGILTILGNNQDNLLSVVRDAAGNIFVNGGAIIISGGLPTVANTVLIRAFGFDGNDDIRVDLSGGVLPPVSFFGGAGNDLLIGGTTADQLNGEDGDDTLAGGRGNDVAFGGDDNDIFIWNPGDGSDTLDGQGGQDELQFNGSAAAETITVSDDGARVRLLRNIGNVVMDIGTVEEIVINALAGNDTVDASSLPAGLTSLVTNGGMGDDVLLGSQGDDLFLGGDGNDLALCGAGNDTFVWNPGDDNDTIEGQDGFDTMLFNGANVAENINLSANGGRLLFFRNVANVVMDANDLEQVIFNAFGGADDITVNDLSGTDVVAVNLDLSAISGPGIPDSLADSVTVTGTQGSDTIVVADSASGIQVTGLSASVTIAGADANLDRLTVNALGGDDVVDANSTPAGLMNLTLNGGLGDDVFLGSEGDDLLVGGDGDDLALCGAGDDTFVWNPGDDNDTIEGQAGFDAMLFNGANVAENINLSANGGRLLFFRNVANVVMDANDVEQVLFNALGGADTIVVNDLSGTDVTEVNLDLDSSSGLGTGDAQPDRVIVNGTSGDDVILVVGSASGVSVLGLAAVVNLTATEAALDQLTINALAGDDVIEASGLAAGAIGLVGDGGADNDVLIGSDGPDVLLGGEGDDVLLGGNGLDVLDGGSGDNIVIQ